MCIVLVSVFLVLKFVVLGLFFLLVWGFVVLLLMLLFVGHCFCLAFVFSLFILSDVTGLLGLGITLGPICGLL